MRKKAACVAAVLLLASPSFAEQKPREVVETIVAKAKDLGNKSRYKENTSVIENYVDFHKLTIDSLGINLKQASSAQQKEIETLLKGILTKTIYPKAPEFFQDVQLEFTNEKSEGEKIHIVSVVTKKERRSTVEYWLLNEQGQYRVIDLAIEGERWIETVQTQFDEVIQKQGVNGLIKKMKKRFHELSQKG